MVMVVIEVMRVMVVMVVMVVIEVMRVMVVMVVIGVMDSRPPLLISLCGIGRSLGIWVGNGGGV